MRIAITEADLNTALALLAVWAKGNRYKFWVIKNMLARILTMVNNLAHIEIQPINQGTPYSITPLDLYNLILTVIQ